MNDESRPVVGEDDLRRWSEALAGIARTGLAFTDNQYEQERFEEVLHVAADMAAALSTGWSPDNFVAEWMTASTPCCAARMLIGVAKVMSAARMAPADRAARRAGSMSKTRSVGLVGSSMRTTRVRGVSAASQAVGSDGSTKVVVIPRFGSSPDSRAWVAP